MVLVELGMLVWGAPPIPVSLHISILLWWKWKFKVNNIYGSLQTLLNSVPQWQCAKLCFLMSKKSLICNPTQMHRMVGLKQTLASFWAETLKLQRKGVCGVAGRTNKRHARIKEDSETAQECLTARNGFPALDNCVLKTNKLYILIPINLGGKEEKSVRRKVILTHFVLSTWYSPSAIFNSFGLRWVIVKVRRTDRAA